MGSEMVFDRFQANPLLKEATDENLREMYSDRNTTVSRQEKTREKFAGLGAGVASIVAENVLSHPFIVLRRQCQVNPGCQWYHWTPFTLMPVIYNLNRHQGVLSQWKGIGSTSIVKGIAMVTEGVISEVTPFPKEVTYQSSCKKLGQHLLLKSAGFIISLPFHASSVVETVQSEIASERPGVFDVIKEGIYRIVGSSSTTQSARILPVWQLVGPTLFHSLSHYTISSLTQYMVLVWLRKQQEAHPEGETETRRLVYPNEQYFPELVASFTGSFLADFVLYPLETITNRLLIQGTRTIIDNIDNGTEVLPVMTDYEGFVDCLREITAKEGFGALWKGFGALLLQYGLQFIILKVASVVFRKMSEDFSEFTNARSNHQT